MASLTLIVLRARQPRMANSTSRAVKLGMAEEVLSDILKIVLKKLCLRIASLL